MGKQWWIKDDEVRLLRYKKLKGARYTPDTNNISIKWEPLKMVLVNKRKDYCRGRGVHARLDFWNTQASNYYTALITKHYQ